MSRLLSDTARAELLAKYKADRIMEAPKNILDATLIKNYGTYEQKKLLPAETQTQPAPSPSGGVIKGSPETNEVGNERAEKELKYQKELYKELYNVEAPESFDLDTLTGENIAKQNELNAAKTGSEDPKGVYNGVSYLDAFNHYIKLHNGKAPEANMSTADLVNANSDTINALAQKPNEANEAVNVNSGDMENESTKKSEEVSEDEVVLYNKELNMTKKFKRFTYENYMKNDKAWSLPPAVPQEVKEL